MLSVPGGDMPLRLTNSVLRHLSDVRYALVCTQQMDQTCFSWFLTGTKHSLHEYDDDDEYDELGFKGLTVNTLVVD